MRILVVEDDPISMEMLVHVLSQAGHEVETAVNGRDAFEKLREGRIRLVISDWEMPEMNGLDLCRAVRNGEFGGYIYIILLTGRDGSQSTVEGLSAGADEFVVKPFNPAELTVRIRTGERILSLETRDLTIFALAKLAESRDLETGMHLERVRNYSRVVARDLQRQPRFANEVDAGYVGLIYLTSPLHDIGKVGVPDSILLKPGRLSDAEFEIMKTHTTLGARTLDAALKEHPEAGFLRMARDIAASHHERFDGTGYPAGLAGKNIPLCGRIVAIADVYDALISKRVYKGAFSHEVARNIILEGSGKHFDPDMVDSFRTQERQFIEIHKQYAEASVSTH